MKKLNGNGKLALHRETLVALNASDLDGVVGGNAQPAGPISQAASHLAPEWLRHLCKYCAAATLKA